MSAPVKPKKRQIEQYAHADKTRPNNPAVGLVTPTTDPHAGTKKIWAYDPHIDPSLQWAGKAERASFEAPTVSLHVHERIDPHTIIQAVRKPNGKGGEAQVSLFERERREPLREAIDFYRHAHQWSNRLVAGDSLLVMNSLLEKEGMAGKVQCVYMDPPYGIKYGSNFQPFTSQRDVKDGKDEDLTAEPEMIKAFRDTWELGIHSYLSYLRDRLLLARELLTESGSVFVQISDENVHHVREIMDEIFGAGNFVSLISYASTSGFSSSTLSRAGDYIVWFAKQKQQIKFRSLYKEKEFRGEGSSAYRHIELADGKRVSIAEWEKEHNAKFEYENRPANSRIFSIGDLISQNPPQKPQIFNFRGKSYEPKIGNHWKANHPDGMERLKEKNRIEIRAKGGLSYVRYFEDFPCIQITNLWTDTGSSFLDKYYVVQTSNIIIQRCLLMTTDPGDLVFDPTCGSGTTAFVAEQWGRRWITCDTSRVATTLAKQRLMTATFDYYKLAYPDEGVGSGFQYKSVPHITLKSIANNEPPATETLYDQPVKDRKKARVTGPFTVEAVPAPRVQSIADAALESGDPSHPAAADASITRAGETLRQGEWRDELLQAGIRGKAGQRITFARMEPWPGRWLHADAETQPNRLGADHISDSAAAQPQRAAVSFGPEHAPLEQRQVEGAWQEARTLMPRPELLIFVAFQFDPEAAKDINALGPEKTDMQMLTVQMNADMQTEDLKKKRASNESFWLIGQPDVSLRPIRQGDHAGQWQVQVNGFDYFNTRTGELESGGNDRIAVWLLDTNYDGRSLCPTQVFFPMADAKSGWTKLAKNLRAEIDEELIESYRGTLSLPFEMGDKERVAVKIVDDRGVESLRILPLSK